MISANRIRSAGGAADYLSKVDDYYRDSEMAPTSWEGRGAEALGLSGEVNAETFKDMLNGRLPDGTQIGGNGKHNPGHDLTISAPKSVSILALNGGDERLIAAHDRAVKAAIKHVEEHAATTRIKSDGVVKTVATDNLCVATFRHSASRNQQELLHTHAVVINATQDENGKWRAFESKALYKMQKELDTVYKNEMARECSDFGYQTRETKDGFEIVGVSQEFIDSRSSRNEQIDKALAEIGKTRETATAAEREVAALKTRADKGEVDHAEMISTWKQDAIDFGVDLQAVIDKSYEHRSKDDLYAHPHMDTAIKAVQQAQDHLAERQCRFSAHDLEKESMRFARLGGASKEEIRQAIEMSRAKGDLLDRQTYAHDTHTGQKTMLDGYTTAKSVKTEESMLDMANKATGDRPVEVVTRFTDKDRDLAREALINDARLNEYKFFDSGNRDAQVKQMLKDGGKKLYDKSGREYVQAKDGRVYAPDLYKNVTVHESRNVNHLGLTKTKYIVKADGTVLKQGGTLTSEFAGWAKEKLNTGFDPDRKRNELLEKMRTGEMDKVWKDKKLHAADKKTGELHAIPDKWKSEIGHKTTFTDAMAKRVATQLTRHENWQKCSGLEAATVRQIIADKGEAAQKQARKDLEKQATGIKSRHIAHPEPIATMKQAEAAIKAQEQKTGHKFNADQIAATKGILTDKDRITLIQGYAGTAKTTSCLDAAAQQMKERGYTVVAMAPGNDAATTLGKSIGTESFTVESHLRSCERAGASAPEGSKQVWIMDEAGTLSAKDMERLLQAAEKYNAKLVAVGDTSQLGSVAAGAAFRQLQEQSDLKTYKLTEIVRQSNSELKEAIYDSIKGDIKGSLEKMDVKEIEKREDRVAAIATDYAKLTPDERRETIVITPGKDDRALVNQAIREELKKDGTLTGEAKTITTLQDKGLTDVEKKLAVSYEKDDIVKDRAGYAKVVEVNREHNKLIVEREDGTRQAIDPEKTKGIESYTESTREIQVGEKLSSTSNDAERGIKKGDTLRVEKIEGNNITCKTDAGKTVTLDASKTADRRVDHGYATTTFPAQGKTCDRVFIHAESHRANLQTQQNHYVAASRAKVEARVYTNNEAKLTAQLEKNTGQKETALEFTDKDKRDREERLIVKREMSGGKDLFQATIIAGKEMDAKDAAAAAKAKEAEKPVAEKIIDDKTVPEKPVAEKIIDDKTVAEKPVAEKIIDDKSVSEKPVAEKTADDKSVSEKPVAEKTADDKSVSEKPVAEKIIDDKSVSEKPVAEKTADDKAVVADKSAAEIRTPEVKPEVKPTIKEPQNAAATNKQRNHKQPEIVPPAHLRGRVLDLSGGRLDEVRQRASVSLQSPVRDSLELKSADKDCRLLSSDSSNSGSAGVKEKDIAEKDIATAEKAVVTEPKKEKTVMTAEDKLKQKMQESAIIRRETAKGRTPAEAAATAKKELSVTETQRANVKEVVADRAKEQARAIEKTKSAERAREPLTLPRPAPAQEQSNQQEQQRNQQQSQEKERAKQQEQAKSQGKSNERGLSL
jgi:conjugative relaxase-like TrwC/TraI family protein